MNTQSDTVTLNRYVFYLLGDFWIFNVHLLRNLFALHSIKAVTREVFWVFNHP